MVKYEWTIPVKVVSTANLREHWRVKHARTLKQKALIGMLIGTPEVALPCTIVMTRISPRPIDEDNLYTALKYFKDALAEIAIPNTTQVRTRIMNGRSQTYTANVGKADGSKDITWIYQQEKGKPKEYALKIEIICEKEQSVCF